jgi:hypothetical protein
MKPSAKFYLTANLPPSPLKQNLRYALNEKTNVSHFWNGWHLGADVTDLSLLADKPQLHGRLVTTPLIGEMQNILQ